MPGGWKWQLYRDRRGSSRYWLRRIIRIRYYTNSLKYTLAAAQALLDVPGMDAEQIARKAMKIAADLCVFTNHTHMVEVLDGIAKDDKIAK